MAPGLYGRASCGTYDYQHWRETINSGENAIQLLKIASNCRPVRNSTAKIRKSVGNILNLAIASFERWDG